MTFYTWSETAANNDTADPTINLREGWAPRLVNNSCRAMMAAAAKYRDDMSGTLETAGTTSAFTVTTNQGLDPLASVPDGLRLTVRAHATNAANATLEVDGTGAKALRLASGAALPAATMIEGTPYQIVYYAETDEYLFIGIPNLYNVPLGVPLPYISRTAPNSAFVLPYGQAISRITYAALYAICGDEFGAGNGVDTFNLPDLRGRAVFGLDDMGGADAGRITSAVSGCDGTQIGAVGGGQAVTLPRSALPNVALSGSGSTNPSGDHTHEIFQRSNDGGSPNAARTTDGLVGGLPRIQTQPAGNHAHTVSITTASMNGGVAQTAVIKLPPAIILPYIMRVL